MSFVWVDFAIVIIVALSAAISVVRGFVREALALTGWIAAFWIALTFAEPLSQMLENQISVPSLRHGVAFFALFTATLIFTSLAVYLVGLVMEKTGLSGTDRMLGVIFGLVRGVIIVALMVLVAGFTLLPYDPWWRESLLLPYFETLALEIKSLLPAEIARHFNVDAY